MNIINESEFQSGLCIDHVTRKHDLHRTALSDQTRQTLRAAAAGHDTEIDLGLRELCVLAADPQITREREFVSAAETKSVDHRDRRFRE